MVNSFRRENLMCISRTWPTFAFGQPMQEVERIYCVCCHYRDYSVVREVEKRDGISCLWNEVHSAFSLKTCTFHLLATLSDTVPMSPSQQGLSQSSDFKLFCLSPLTILNHIYLDPFFIYYINPRTSSINSFFHIVAFVCFFY